jgi:hypothetical protein
MKLRLILGKILERRESTGATLDFVEYEQIDFRLNRFTEPKRKLLQNEVRSKGLAPQRVEIWLTFEVEVVALSESTRSKFA